MPRQPRTNVRAKILRAEAEEAAGRSWRAKEILGGCVGTLDYGVSHELLGAYGALLDRLGDRYQAGKYLFLAGSADPDHQDAIRVYLRRNRNVAANDLVAQFPAALRHQGLGNLPETVISELQRRGVAASELQRTEPRPDVVLPGSPRDTALILAVLSFLVFSIVLWAIGLMTFFRWARSLVD